MIRGGKVIIMHGKWIEERLKLLLTEKLREKVGHNVHDDIDHDDLLPRLHKIIWNHSK